MADDWVWTVEYADGSRTTEAEMRGIERAKLRGDVRALELRWAARPDLPPFRVVVPEGGQPIFFRRRQQRIKAAGGLTVEPIITVIGWKKTIPCGDGHAVKSLLWLMPDGRVELTDRDDGRVI
jgi:hypothetical protein